MNKRSVHVLLSTCTKASFAETHRKQHDFVVKKHCRILIETESTYLFCVACLKITVFANYAIFSSLLFASYFVVNAM